MKAIPIVYFIIDVHSRSWGQDTYFRILTSDVSRYRGRKKRLHYKLNNIKRTVSKTNIRHRYVRTHLSNLKFT